MLGGVRQEIGEHLLDAVGVGADPRHGLRGDDPQIDVVQVGIGAIALGIPGEYLLAHHYDKRLDAGPTWVRWLLYYAFILAILVFGEFGARPFFYFQF